MHYHKALVNKRKVRIKEIRWTSHNNFKHFQNLQNKDLR